MGAEFYPVPWNGVLECRWALIGQERTLRAYESILVAQPIFVMRQGHMKARELLIAALGSLVLAQPTFAQSVNGKNLYTQRCAMCHGADIKGTGPLAKKSNPPTPDLTTAAFKKRLNDYPGVIVSSVILRPNGDLIPRTLRENGVKLSPHSWTVQDFRDLNKYMSDVISKSR
ncbi:Cytochrome c [compost metagenome]